MLCLKLNHSIIPFVRQKLSTQVEVSGVFFFRRYIQAFLSSQLLYRTGYFWLGLSDTAKTGTYAWDSGDNVMFTYWHNTHTGKIESTINMI